MWVRGDLKQRAKDVLKRIYWKAFLISLVIAAVKLRSGSSGDDDGSSEKYVSVDSLALTGILVIIAAIAILVFILSLRVFLGYALEVGGRRYFIKSAEYGDNKKCFRFAFNGETYIGIVLAMLLKGIQNFLWYLLLIIPGIIKSYSYRMVPYILADNPNIGAKRAIKLSTKMTDGHKFDMFVLDLSFIGWYLLGMIPLGLGVFFVLPYTNATEAELYLVLRRNALENQLCTYSELYKSQD